MKVLLVFLSHVSIDLFEIVDTVSSAYSRPTVWQKSCSHFGMSLVSKRNSTGLSIDPCGTFLLTSTNVPESCFFLIFSCVHKLKWHKLKENWLYLLPAKLGLLSHLCGVSGRNWYILRTYLSKKRLVTTQPTSSWSISLCALLTVYCCRCRPCEIHVAG